MNLALVFQPGDFVLISVFIILVIMNIVTWSTIILRAIRLRKAKNGNAAAKRLVLVSFTLNEVVQKAKSVDSPMGRLTEEAVKAHQNYRQSDVRLLTNALPLNEYLVTQIHNSMSQIIRQFDDGMISLAFIGAAAPLIGLPGVVWGIYHALINIGQGGQMSIAAVAGLIGEALVSTAAGPLAAIPAVLVYNFPNRSTRTLPQDMDAYTHDLHARLSNQKD